MSNEWPLPNRDLRGKPLSEPTEAQLEARKKFQEMLRPNTAPSIGDLMDRAVMSYAQGVADERARIEAEVEKYRRECSDIGGMGDQIGTAYEILRRIRDKERPT